MSSSDHKRRAVKDLQTALDPDSPKSLTKDMMLTFVKTRGYRSFWEVGTRLRRDLIYWMATHQGILSSWMTEIDELRPGYFDPLPEPQMGPCRQDYDLLVRLHILPSDDPVLFAPLPPPSQTDATKLLFDIVQQRYVEATNKNRILLDSLSVQNLLISKLRRRRDLLRPPSQPSDIPPVSGQRDTNPSYTSEQEIRQHESAQVPEIPSRNFYPGKDIRGVGSEQRSLRVPPYNELSKQPGFQLSSSGGTVRQGVSLPPGPASQSPSTNEYDDGLRITSSMFDHLETQARQATTTVNKNLNPALDSIKNNTLSSSSSSRPRSHRPAKQLAKSAAETPSAGKATRHPSTRDNGSSSRKFKVLVPVTPHSVEDISSYDDSSSSFVPDSHAEDNEEVDDESDGADSMIIELSEQGYVGSR